MADPTDTNPDLAAALKEGGIVSDAAPASQEYQPIYKMITDSKIPVSKKMGSFWKARKEMAAQARKSSGIETAWQEAVRYYNNDQLFHRTSRMFGSGNTVNSSKISDTWSETENVVFSNTATMLPLLYSKNPSVECTTTNEDKEDIATMYEHLANVLMQKKDAPGVNLKPAARRAILHALLTNEGWLKIGWTTKADSSEQALEDLQKLSKELSEATDTKEIQRLEGDIMALDATIDLLTPSGPFRKVVSPFNMLSDPDSVDPGMEDCNWQMECDMLPTAFIQAVYAKKNGDDKDVLIYQPTHVLKLKSQGGTGADDDDVAGDVNSFTLGLGASDTPIATYGYSDNDTFNRSLMTKVWYVWDKTTRRIYMFNDRDWTWPIWVWNDPLKLTRFFPYFRLHFHEVFQGSNGRGEVTYYLDQQDAINEINSEMQRARTWLRRNVFFDKASGLTQQDVEAVLKGTDGTARGINLPEGKGINDILLVPQPPALKFPQLFDTGPKFAAIDRISSVSAVIRGEQFKTNTTNQAVQSYNQSTAIRTDEKTDAIEDWLGDFGYALIQLCAANMDQQTVANLIGDKLAAAWEQKTTDDFRGPITMNVVGGSTEKPTSQTKKQQALQIGQILGQFAAKSPAVVMMLLKVMERAFDEVIVTKDDWQMLEQQIQAQIQQEQQQPPDGGAGGAPGGNPLEQMIQSLPPPAQQALQQAIQKGVPPMQALMEILHHMQGQPGQQPAGSAQGEQQ